MVMVGSPLGVPSSWGRGRAETPNAKAARVKTVVNFMMGLRVGVREVWKWAGALG